MKSALPKVLHPLAGLALIEHVWAAVEPLNASHIGVVVSEELDVQRGESFVQHERLGTAHAVLQARPILERSNIVLVCYGDTPLVSTEVLAGLVAAVEAGAAVAVAGFACAQPNSYGRVVLDEQGDVDRILESRDLSAEARASLPLCNGGLMALDARFGQEALPRIGCDNAAGEHYLTDAVQLARAEGRRCAWLESDAVTLCGVNDLAELARAEAHYQARKRLALMAQGARLVAPESVWLSHDTTVQGPCMIEPFVVLGPKVVLESDVHIRSHSFLEGCTVRRGAVVGPYARLRPGADIGEGARVGNFVEVKNARLGRGAKANHLSYVGDAEVGAQANIGAGVITCNYDGQAKHTTRIGCGAFIGSNASLVAPVSIGDGAMVGAGSTVTRDVDASMLAVARSPQKVVRRLRKKES